MLTKLRPLTLAALAPALLPPVRLELRDRTIRDSATRFYGTLSPTGAAKAMASDFAVSEPVGTPKGEVLALIVALNDGTLRWRQLFTIIAGGRCNKPGKIAKRIAQGGIDRDGRRR